MTMNLRSLQISVGSIIQIAVGGVVLSLLLAACGGGGKSAGDTYPALPVAAPGFTGPNSFLLFPNSIKQSDASYQIDTLAYAQAYYKAIDPNNSRNTYTKWLTANQFGSASGVEVTVTFGDKRDLGYGRYITARKNADGTIAMSVRNYLVPPAAGYGYSTMNMDAAVARDERWYIGSSNIEFSPASPASGVAGVGFAKFYFFAPDGSRALMVNLDGRGAKAMPGPCISCHGGRGDPLTAPDGNGEQLFPLVHNSASLARGDVQGHFHPLEPDNFDFSSVAGFTRADQEATIKLINTWALSSYPLPYGTTVPTGFAEDADRRVANLNEWQGVAATLIKDGYGGDGLPNTTYSDSVPAAWAAVGQSTLYQNSFVPACRVCHILRGMGRAAEGQGSDIDMTTFAKFDGYSDQIKAHVIDSGNMPLAKILYEKFWSSSTQYESMANYLEAASQVARDSAKAVLRPGRPVAVAGPDRIIKGGVTTLSATASMYATSYTWSIASDPVGGATLSDPASATPVFTPAGNGTYLLKLVVGKDGIQSEPSQVTIVVDSTSTLPVPSAIRFTTDIKPILQRVMTPVDPRQQCTSCHNDITPAFPTPQAPVAYNNYDRNGDAAVNSTDDYWLYTDIKGRINFDDVADSPLLLKPAGHHHGGSMLSGFGDIPNKLPAEKLLPGDVKRKDYDIFLNWVLNGAPY
jgi:mono/diheme cytochrome c family protein